MLTKLRKEHGLSQHALAKSARTTAGYIGILETGTKRNASPAVVGRLAKALGVPVAELLS